MAVNGWIVDKSALVRATDPVVSNQLIELAGVLHICPVGELELLYSARSARDYDAQQESLHETFKIATPPPDIFERALRLQRDLAHHHGMWHRIPIPDLLIAETAIHHGLGVLHVDNDFTRIAEVRPLVLRKVG